MNPMDFLKNMQDIQSRVGEMQEKMKTITVTGSAGGEMVKVEIDGRMNVRKVDISPEVVDPDDVEMIEDLVLAAFTDALANLRERMQEEMSALTGDMNLPPGLLGM